MGNLIHYENWDGVTAPAIPSGWTVSSPLETTSSPTGGVSPLSSPNVLGATPGGSNSHLPATYSVADGNSGNVLVYASFAAASTSNNQTFGVFARASAYPVVIGSSTFYWAQLSTSGQVCRLYGVVGGVESNLASVDTGFLLADGIWYQLQLSCEQSTISVSVSRASDGYWLNSSGSFQASPAVAITVTDTSVTGSGYAGVTLQSRSDNAYTDEWYFYEYSGLPAPQPPPLRSLPIIHAARGRGLVWQPIPPRLPIPPSMPFAWWPIAKRIETSEFRRRIAPGRASTARSFARLERPPSIPFAWWKTIRWLDQSERLWRYWAGRVWCPAAAVVPGSQINEGWTQEYITNVNPPVQHGTELYLSWGSVAPPGLMFQVYQNDQLVWTGSSPYCTLPLPQCLVRFDIGTVGFTQKNTSFASLLPPAPLLQAELTWLGGTFEGPDIAGFHVYGEEAPGAGINYTNILATIPAYTAGIITDGYGYGGFGLGGFGEAPGSYSWISDSLSSGTWHYAVVPFDTSGNEGTAATTSVTILAPPQECSPFDDHTRLQYVYNSSLREITLSWNPSPG